jgi:hypothetical protein
MDTFSDPIRVFSSCVVCSVSVGGHPHVFDSGLRRQCRVSGGTTVTSGRAEAAAPAFFYTDSFKINGRQTLRQTSVKSTTVRTISTTYLSVIGTRSVRVLFALRFGIRCSPNRFWPRNLKSTCYIEGQVLSLGILSPI